MENNGTFLDGKEKKRVVVFKPQKDLILKALSLVFYIS